eukprot:CAMPEP_0206594298 /NCGR_PEP_ID=MMETSP0325_2-20121206/42280_1 /ASSEMBLY_ACC=CAM_ASM_000347 /TAXON_ID=2866 /ORGANISM="Crypthecodinium cohnii, Strain Seligo" /LENGTH=191 /DNA_ID=CAMNT_0054104711 /DNA_START=487 /DNA_END=1062 /DNA_ORIENTATION=-
MSTTQTESSRSQIKRAKTTAKKSSPQAEAALEAGAVEEGRDPVRAGQQQHEIECPMNQHRHHEGWQAITHPTQKFSVAQEDADDETRAAVEWDGQHHSDIHYVDGIGKGILDVFCGGKACTCRQAVHCHATSIHDSVFEQDAPNSNVFQKLFEETCPKVAFIAAVAVVWTFAENVTERSSVEPTALVINCR